MRVAGGQANCLFEKIEQGEAGNGGRSFVERNRNIRIQVIQLMRNRENASFLRGIPQER